MTNETLAEAQDYLTIERDDGYKRIVDIQHLLQSHSIKEVIKFLKDYLQGKERALRSMILIDKTHRKVDQYVAAMFRMTMAIKTLEGEEAIILERSKQGAKKSSKLHNRNSGSDHGTRSGKDRSDDAAHRIAGNETQRAA
jgi:hypothetical protein